MNNQKGLMVLDLIIAIAMSSIIALGAGITTTQILKHSESNKDYATVVRQAQNVGFSISQDLLMARMISTVDNATTPDVEFITIIWKDWETGYKHDIRYVWSNPADALKKVIRESKTYDADGQEINNTNTLLADNIYSANLTPPYDAWKLVVEARSGEKSAVREYEANQRVD